MEDFLHKRDPLADLFLPVANPDALPDDLGVIRIDTDVYLVLTRRGDSFVSDDPLTVPRLLAAIGPATLGTDGYTLPEDLAKALARRIGIDLQRPETWPREPDDFSRLRAAHPELRILTPESSEQTLDLPTRPHQPK